MSEIQTLADLINTFADNRNWHQYHTPKNLSMALAGEAGELLAEFQWLTPEQSMKESLNKEQLANIELEIADVAIYLIRLADVLGVNIVDVVNKKITINEARFKTEGS
jgi:dCTP diphosphatase